MSMVSSKQLPGLIEIVLNVDNEVSRLILQLSLSLPLLFVFVESDFFLLLEGIGVKVGRLLVDCSTLVYRINLITQAIVTMLHLV
jgi:hypothetical protein